MSVWNNLWMPVAAAGVFALIAALAGPARADAAADAAVAELRNAVAVERLRTKAPRLQRAQFLSQPQLLQATLSPDGRRLAWLAERGGQRGVWLQDLPKGAPRRVLAQTTASELAWSRDGRWLLLPAPRQLTALAVAGQVGSGVIAALGGHGRRQYLWVDPVLPAAALLLERPPRIGPGRWRLLRVEVGSAPAVKREEVLHESVQPIVDAVIGDDGKLAWLMRAEGEAHVLYPVDGNRLGKAQLRCERMRRCLLLGHASDGGAWLNSNADGDLTGLLHLDRQGRLHRQHQDPRGEADLVDIVLDPVDGSPRFVGYRSTVPQLFALANSDDAALSAIHRQLPGRTLRIEAGRGNGAYWLVHERADTLRGERLWLADPGTGRLTQVLGDVGFVFNGKPQARPDEAAMAHKWPLRWRASDGRWLHGFVTLPPGVDVANAPLVASVHGGPFSLVRPDFSNDAQLLANRGYIVFQPNFRGSTGLGRDYLFAAGGDFGHGRVQQDIVDGVRWLLANGVGDGGRVGIVGASFGGYSALLGITFQPELFKVGIAAVPPADFGWVVREYLGTGQEMVPGVPMVASMRHLGLDPADPVLMARLTKQSPIVHAATLRRPLLMLAGGEDERVPIRGVTHYAARLQSLGKDVSLFIDTEAGHNPGDTRTREAYYYLMERLLHRQLGGAEPEPPGRELTAHLQRNLRLSGKSLQP